MVNSLKQEIDKNKQFLKQSEQLNQGVSLSQVANSQLNGPQELT